MGLYISLGISIGTALILLFTLILALQKLKREKIALGIKTLYDLQNEYRSQQITEAKKYILDYYNEKCDKDPEKWKTNYFNTIKQIADLGKRRQTFSHFYQKLAHFYVKKIITNDLLFPAWPWKDFEMIGELILPIEKDLSRPSQTALDNLQKLYYDFRKWKNKDSKKQT